MSGRILLTVLSSLIFFIFVQSAYAEVTVAVPRFTIYKIENTGKIKAKTVRNYSVLSGYEYTELEIENGKSRLNEIDCPVLTDVFVRHLSNSGRVTVVERSKADKIMGEIKLGEDGYLDAAALVKKGRLLGAQYLVIGTVIQADMGFEIKEVPYTEQHTLYEKGAIRVEARVIETETGRIVTAKLGEGLTTKKKAIPSNAYGTKLEQYDPFFDQPFLQDMYNALATDLTSKVVSAFYPFKIALVSDKTVTANRGSKFGIAVGDVYSVFREGDEVKDPDTGKILGKAEQIIAVATVDSVQDEMCTLVLSDIKMPVKTGDVLKSTVDPKTKFRDTPY